MAGAAANHIADRCFCESTGTPLFSRPHMARLLDELTDTVDRLLERAKAAGEVREDVNGHDILILLGAVGYTGLKLEAAAPGSWQRYLDLILDGLRPEGARPLSRKPLTPKQREAARRGYGLRRP
jgi:hypothetical protein